MPWIVVQNPTAGGEGGAPHHVLPGGIAGGVVEAQIDELVGQIVIDVEQLRHAGGGFGFVFDGGEVVLHPRDEIAPGARILEDEDRRALHGIGDDGDLHAARQVQQLHAAIVRGDERAFGGGHRDDEVALRVFAVDAQRAGKADRDLGDPGEVLDVAFGRVRIERILPDVLRLRAGHLLDQRLPLFDDGVAVVVVGIARNADALHFIFRDGVFDLELQLAEGLGLKGDLDLVQAQRQRREARVQQHRRAQGKSDRGGRRDLIGLQGFARRPVRA